MRHRRHASVRAFTCTTLSTRTNMKRAELSRNCKEAFKERLTDIHGMCYGTSLRRITGVHRARWALLLRWRRNDRSTYNIQYIGAQHGATFRGDFEDWSCLMLYSFSHIEPLEDHKVPFPSTEDCLEIDDSRGLGIHTMNEDAQTRIREIQFLLK